MYLVYFLIQLALANQFVRLSFYQFGRPTAQLLHEVCLKNTPENTKSKEVLQALVCGENFSTESLSLSYITSGLIHLFVVSGSHLLLFFTLLSTLKDKIQKYLHRTKWFMIFDVALWILIILYSFMCELNPPVIRSLMSLILAAVLQKLNLFWPAHLRLLLVGLFCFIFEPAWVNSLSLQMSWIAGLSLVLIAQFFKNESSLFKQSLFYINYFFTFNFLGFPSIASLFVAVFFTPVLEFILFPLGLIIFLIPTLTPLFDGLITGLNFMLQHLELPLFQRLYESTTATNLNWFFIFAVHFFLCWFNDRQTQIPT